MVSVKDIVSKDSNLLPGHFFNGSQRFGYAQFPEGHCL